MTPEDLARLTEEERELWLSCDEESPVLGDYAWEVYRRDVRMLLTRLSLARAVEEAARPMISGVDLRLLGGQSADGDAARAAVAALADALAAHDAEVDP